MDADRTAVFWIRAGAASGMLAVAVQSVWDTGLRMPANAVLFSLLAAIALHDGSRSTQASVAERHRHDERRRHHAGAPPTMRET
jgi:hypothetical protein